MNSDVTFVSKRLSLIVFVSLVHRYSKKQTLFFLSHVFNLNEWLIIIKSLVSSARCEDKRVVSRPDLTFHQGLQCYHNCVRSCSIVCREFRGEFETTFGICIQVGHK